MRSRHYGLNLIADKIPDHSEIFIENYFKTKHKKNALLSYIIYPFIGESQNNHSNHKECFKIAEILKEMGYNVDVINWNNNSFMPSKKYDIVIDNHNNLQRLSTHFDGHTKKIFHATNAHWLYQNSVEYSRYEQFFLKYAVAIVPPRLMAPGNSAEYADAISMFGNEFTKNSYGTHAAKVHHVPMSVTTDPEIIEGRNYTKAKKRFLWLNSHGALLKGLDIVIEAFMMRPELQLFVCGNTGRDAEFMNTIKSRIARASNITIEGWVDIEGERFKILVAECAWVVSASFSEGGGGSTLNAMAKGLIPLISRSSSITLPAKTGFYLENNNATAVVDLLKTVSELPDDELKETSLNAVNFIATHHTLENFKSKYKDFLMKMTSSRPQIKPF